MQNADDFSLEVIDLIQKAIADSGLSNAEVIKRTQISQDYFYTRARGEKPFNTNDISRICNVLGINPLQLMSRASSAGERKHVDKDIDYEQARLARTMAKIQDPEQRMTLAAYRDPDKGKEDPFNNGADRPHPNGGDDIRTDATMGGATLQRHDMQLRSGATDRRILRRPRARDRD